MPQHVAMLQGVVPTKATGCVELWKINPVNIQVRIESYTGSICSRYELKKTSLFSMKGQFIKNMEQ